jgi:hypothetical protein
MLKNWFVLPLAPSPRWGKGKISEIWVFGAAELPQTPKFPVLIPLLFHFFGGSSRVFLKLKIS